MVHFVGAGSGAADLITVRGARLLREADVVIYAGSLVNPDLLAETKPACRRYDSAAMTLEQVLAVMEEAEAAGETTVRLHSGDPCLYGAVREQYDALDRLGIPYDVCPGVSALCAAAAALRTEYTLPETGQTVVITRVPGRTPVPEAETVRALAAPGSALAVFLSASLSERLQADLLAGGWSPDAPAAVVRRASWPDEEVYRCTVKTLPECVAAHGITRTALILAGDFLGERRGRSRLYDPAFSTGYRRGEAAP